MPKKPLPIPASQLSKETTELYNVLNDEKDLPAILISSSFLDACLVSIIEKKFIQKSSTASKLLSPSGALGSFNARAGLCYALGLLPKSYFEDLKNIGEIRNRVAHHRLELSFDDEEIHEICSKLHTHLVGQFSNAQGRLRFKLCVVTVAQRLIITALGLEEDGRVSVPKEPKIIYGKIGGSVE